MNNSLNQNGSGYCWKIFLASQKKASLPGVLILLFTNLNVVNTANELCRQLKLSSTRQRLLLSTDVLTARNRDSNPAGEANW